MKYIINYINGRLEWSDKLDLQTMLSLISSEVVVSVIDVKGKRALISNMKPEGRNIGWTPIPKHADFSEESLKKLEENDYNTEKDLES